ncbi:hypothetical protein [Puia dinghuensis]|uniref:hypothetical protein n=1 Tax=Puia dinghuensis TaxID=1792502 RepID=UPI00166C10BA|nr:hypothetical protein [Puia dinghuensis]
MAISPATIISGPRTSSSPYWPYTSIISGPWPSRLLTFTAVYLTQKHLTHKPLIHLTLQLLRPSLGNNTYLPFFAGAGVAFLGGWLLHIIVEKSFLWLRDRLLSKPVENSLSSAMNSR